MFQRTAGVITLTVNGREIRTTSEHPFYHAEKGWLPAGDLVAGDRLVGQYGEVVIVNKVEASGEYETVYNLRVADWHTYFVGGECWGFGVWAHNADYVKDRGFNNKSKIVIGPNQDRWYLPAKYKTSRPVKLKAQADRYGEKLQDKASELSRNWSLDKLSAPESRAIKSAWAKYNETQSSKDFWKAMILTHQAKGRYIESELRNFARVEKMQLEWSRKGPGAFDRQSGVYYEVMSGSKWNFRTHAKRLGMTDKIWRVITF